MQRVVSPQLFHFVCSASLWFFFTFFARLGDWGIVALWDKFWERDISHTGGAVFRARFVNGANSKHELSLMAFSLVLESYVVEKTLFRLQLITITSLLLSVASVCFFHYSSLSSPTKYWFLDGEVKKCILLQTLFSCSSDENDPSVLLFPPTHALDFLSRSEGMQSVAILFLCNNNEPWLPQCHAEFTGMLVKMTSFAMWPLGNYDGLVGDIIFAMKRFGVCLCSQCNQQTVASPNLDASNWNGEVPSNLHFLMWQMSIWQ